MKQNNKDDADSNYHLLSIYRGPDLVLKALHVLHHLILTTRQNGWENIIRQCGRGTFEPRGICRARWPGVRPPFYENQSESLQQSLRMISRTQPMSPSTLLHWHDQCSPRHLRSWAEFEEAMSHLPPSPSLNLLKNACHYGLFLMQHWPAALGE